MRGTTEVHTLSGGPTRRSAPTAGHDGSCRGGPPCPPVDDRRTYRTPPHPSWAHAHATFSPAGRRLWPFRRERSNVDGLPLIRHGCAVPPSPRGRLKNPRTCFDTDPGVSVCFLQSEAQHFSKMVATPWPPPMHRVARPFLASSRFCISCSRVTMMRAPEAPTG